MTRPTMHPSVFTAPDASIYGAVTIEKDSSIWFHTTIRGERATVSIGEGSNVQDNCVIHVDDGFCVVIGKGVTIGHGAIVHGCQIGDNSLIGMGAIILNGAVIGKNCIIGAGALFTQNTLIPDNSLVIGSPAIIKRSVTPAEAASNKTNALHYVSEAKEYAAFLGV